MPLLRCSGDRGWKYGPSGTCYTGKDAKKKALKQALAIGGGEMPVEKTRPVDLPIKIARSEEDKQYVFGWANVSMRDGELVVDSHNDTIDLSELENAAYEFALHFNDAAVGEMHKGDAKGKLIESFVVTPEKLRKMGVSEDAIQLGWWVGMYIEDKDLFAKVKDGEYLALSIQGQAVREKDGGGNE